MKHLRRLLAAVLVTLIVASVQGQTSTGYLWRNFAGQPGGWGSADGTGNIARFYTPLGVAVDSAGNVYVADTVNHTIRKVTSDGVVTTLAGQALSSGTNDGTSTTARFHSPYGVAVDSGNNLYVADGLNHTIRKVTSAGVVTTLAGLGQSSGTNDGTGSAARFNTPHGVAVDSAGIVYVADTYSGTIRRVSSDGVVTTLAGLGGYTGTNDGVGSAARFCQPEGVAVDAAGNVFVADAYNYAIRKVTSAGVVTTLAGWPGNSGTNDGLGSAARFLVPTGVAVDSAGIVYVGDSYNHTIRRVTSAGEVTTLAGCAGQYAFADGTGSAARFNYPAGVALDSTGNLYVADGGNCMVRRVTSAGVVASLAGRAPRYGGADGTGSAAQFFNPTGVAVDVAGNLFVADQHACTIRSVTSLGEVTTLAGSFGMRGSADGTGSAARFDYPSGVAVDNAGNVFVTDQYNSTIRAVTNSGKVTTLAGVAGRAGYFDGTGTRAWFRSGLALRWTVSATYTWRRRLTKLFAS